MQRRTIRIITDDYSHEPALDTAVSRALLMRASRDEIPETIRLHCPGRIIAFGKRDTLESGYADAVHTAVDAGFTPIERLAGGRAAAFTETTIAFAWTTPDPDPRRRIYSRFETLATLMVGAFARLGVPSEVGEIPGEYCPGDYSVHHAGTIKLMGVGQRLAKSAAHVGGVVVVNKPELVRDVLIPVYAALGLEWDPATVGALSDVAPMVTWDDAVGAIRTELAQFAVLGLDTISHETLALARGLVSDHIPEVVETEPR